MSIKKISVIVLLTLGVAAPAASFTACRMNITPVKFGIYDQSSNRPTDTRGQIKVSCVPRFKPINRGVTYTIYISNGLSGNFSDRTMISRRGKLHYNLYQNASYTQVWGGYGSGNGLVGFLPIAKGQRSTQNHIVYGRIPPHQPAMPRTTYVDRLQVVMEY